MKQMLLIFDSIHFLDPVDDDRWRNALMQGLGAGHPQFRQYQAIGTAIPDLVREGAVVRTAPSRINAGRGHAIAAAALSDLLDTEWAGAASEPACFNLPHRSDPLDGSPVWEIFSDKLTPPFLNALEQNPELQHHLKYAGDPNEAWTLSYAAGSAATLNFHLFAADQLQLCPITDSRLHHKLLQMKRARVTRDYSRGASCGADLENVVVNHMAINILDDVLPRDALRLVAFDTILNFRDKTRELRRHFLRDLRLSLVHGSEPGMANLDGIHLRVAKDLREFRAGLEDARNQLWPSLVGSFRNAVPAAGVAAVIMASLGYVGQMFAATAVTAGLTLVKGVLESKGVERTLRANATPAVSYLSHVKDTFG